MVSEFKNFQFDGVIKVNVNHLPLGRREAHIHHMSDDGGPARQSIVNLGPEDDISPLGGGSVEVSIKLKNYQEWADAEAFLMNVRNKLNQILDQDVSCYNPCVLDETIKMLAIARSQMAVATEK